MKWPLLWLALVWITLPVDGYGNDEPWVTQDFSFVCKEPAKGSVSESVKKQLGFGLSFLSICLSFSDLSIGSYTTQSGSSK